MQFSRGVRTEFDNPLYDPKYPDTGVPPPDVDNPSKLPPEHPDFEAEPYCPPKLLFPEAHAKSRHRALRHIPLPKEPVPKLDAPKLAAPALLATSRSRSSSPRAEDEPLRVSDKKKDDSRPAEVAVKERSRSHSVSGDEGSLHVPEEEGDDPVDAAKTVIIS